MVAIPFNHASSRETVHPFQGNLHLGAAILQAVPSLRFWTGEARFADDEGSRRIGGDNDADGSDGRCRQVGDEEFGRGGDVAEGMPRGRGAC